MIKTLLLSLLVFTYLFGQNLGLRPQTFPFAGVSLSTQTINIEPGESNQKTGFGIRYGQQSLDWRTIFSIDYTNHSYSSAFVEVDKILLDDMFGTSKLRPYLGAVVGYMHFDTSDLNIAPDESELFEQTNGFYYGGNFGFIIYATDTVDVDISYHYNAVQNLDFLDNLYGATLAVHYFF